MESRESAAARYRLKIDHARSVERGLQLLGWSVAVLATMSLVGFVTLWMADRLTDPRPLSPEPDDGVASTRTEPPSVAGSG